MASVSRFLTQKLRLKVNEAKSAVARPEERKFLGFSIANDGSERRIAPKSPRHIQGADPGHDPPDPGDQPIERRRHTSSGGAAASSSARPLVCSQTWKR